MLPLLIHEAATEQRFDRLASQMLIAATGLAAEYFPGHGNVRDVRRGLSALPAEPVPNNLPDGRHDGKSGRTSSAVSGRAGRSRKVSTNRSAAMCLSCCFQANWIRSPRRNMPTRLPSISRTADTWSHRDKAISQPPVVAWGKLFPNSLSKAVQTNWKPIAFPICNPRLSLFR